MDVCMYVCMDGWIDILIFEYRYIINTLQCVILCILHSV